jgi:hypothetical protein
LPLDLNAQASVMRRKLGSTPVRLPEPRRQPVQRIRALPQNAMRLRRMCGGRKKFVNVKISDNWSWQHAGTQAE